MKKSKILRQVEIRDITYENLDDIINLIKEIYEDDYPEKEFYDNKIINSYIKDNIDKNNVYWKGAFYKGKLIGQMLSVVKHGVAFLKLAIVSQKFRGMGVMTLVSFHMEQILKNLNESDLKCIYAFVSSKNIPLLKILTNHNFIKLGTTPNHDKNKSSILFGRVSYDFKWKLITPHIGLSQSLYKKIKETGLKRLIVAQPLLLPTIPTPKMYKIKIEKIKDRFPYEILIRSENFIMNNEGICAHLYENEYNKSWYDFRFIYDIPLDLKYQIIKKIVNDFYNTDEINSLSFAIDVNDKQLQNLMLNLNIRYYGFLPFYLNGKDGVLMGITKIQKLK